MKNEDKMSRLEPKNREEAFAHQFKDDVKLLFSLSQLINRVDSYEERKPFYDALETLKIHIKTLEQLKY